MKPDEKRCPLTQLFCYGDECAMFNRGECAILTLAQKAEETVSELYYCRKELENR